MDVFSSPISIYNACSNQLQHLVTHVWAHGLPLKNTSWESISVLLLSHKCVDTFQWKYIFVVVVSFQFTRFDIFIACSTKCPDCSCMLHAGCNSIIIIIIVTLFI